MLKPVLIAFLLLLSYAGHTQTQQTKEQTIDWLKQNLIPLLAEKNSKNPRVNYTGMCVNFNLVAKKDEDYNLEKSMKFKDKLESNVVWKDSEMAVQNNVYNNGRLIETYTYHIPLQAITGAGITSCQPNLTGNINAYLQRPIFVKVKKNSTSITHIKYDTNGQPIEEKKQTYTNKKDADWDSLIPIAGNWDKHTSLQQKTIQAFKQLASQNIKRDVKSQKASFKSQSPNHS